MNNNRCPLRWFSLAALMLLVGASPGLRAAEEKKFKPEVVGHSRSPDLMMLRRETPETPWIPVKEGGELYTGDLVLGLSGAKIQSKNKAVQLTLLSDLNGRSPHPIVESAVVFSREPAEGFDLDFRLNRGRIDLINVKEKGAARVHFLVHGDPWEVTLEEPGCRVALELYGRWARGVPFTPQPGPKDVPNANLVILVLKGEALLKHGPRSYGMKAPPGPALLQWDNVTGADPTPARLDELPDWATGEKPTEEAKKVAAVRQKVREMFLAKGLEKTIDELLNSDNPLARRFAVFAMAALDDLPRLAEAMKAAKHPDVWDNGVLALRHWIGRGPGQDMRFYKALIEKGKLTPLQAEMILSLLHSFSEEEVKQPETYQLLIGYLADELLAIRGLAYWHLRRLVPDGEELGYDPHAPKEKRAQAIARWQKLIPSGKLPPPPKPEPKKDKN